MSSLSMLDFTWVIICAAMVMLMQGGFCFLESGFSRAKNSINVALKNLVDFCAAGIAFFLVGFGIMYGSSPDGLIGLRWPLATADIDPWTLTFFLFQFVFCGTATTIVSGAVAERMRFRTYLVISFFVSAVMYPIFGHWAWGGAGGFGDAGWLAQLGFIDFAGSTVVHSVGGWISLAAVIILGPRIGRFQKQGQQLHGHNLAMAVMGVMILWFGWFGFNGGSTLAMTDKVPLILVNTNLAAATGGIAAILVSHLIAGRIDVSHVLLGVVAGLVGITASCHMVDPWEAILIGTVAAALCIFASEWLVRLKIDDVVGAWPTHAVAGMWGTLAVAIFGDASAFAPGMTRLDQLGIQLLGIVICAAWSFGFGLISLRLIDKLFPFRVSEEDERMGLNVSEHQATTELIDLLSDMNSQTHSGDFQKRVRVEPHTEVGQIAQQYNAVLSRVQSEIDSRDSVAEALRQAEQRYRRIFEDAVEGIFQTTPQGRYLIANPALARIYGYESPGELIESVSDISKEIYAEPSRRDEFRRQMELHGSVTGFESMIRRKDGSTGWISESARAVRDDVGNILYYEGTVEDISQQRLARRMQREIEVAQHASQAKSDFLAHVSHEIRTPLNGIIGMLELLQQSTLTDSQANYVRVARSSSRLLLSVINDVLDFSKIEAGKLETSPHEFNIVGWIEEIIESFAPIAEKKGITLRYDLPSNLPNRWNADADRLKQIATNLIGNAIKFTEKGSVSLKISIVEEDHETAILRFAVRDTGIGIPSDRLSRLFQPFSQVDASTTRKYGGTGLGLAISRKLAELLGGELAVTSHEGVGSEFFWTARLGKTSSAESASRPLPPQLQATRAIVISSVPTDGDVLTSYFQRWGIECERVNDLSSAIARIGAQRPSHSIDLVLIDDTLLGADPSQAIHRLQSFTRPPMVMSLVPLGKVAASSQRSIHGLAGYITRPIIQSRLFDALIDAFDQKREASPSNPVRASRPVSSRSQAMFGGRSILVAEDNEVNQFVIKEILERQGFAVALASSGRQAVEQVQKNSFDLVLMDCQMPEMDGFQATRAIRDWETVAGSAPLPIVALTASAIRGDRERCLDAGMNDYITKPIDQNRLRELLKKYLVSSEPSLPKEDNPGSSQADESNMIEPLDTRGLFDRCSKDADFAARLLEKFILRLRTDRERIEQEAAKSHFQELANIGHSLLGAASTAGASLLAQAASQLDAHAREMDQETVQLAASHLLTEIDRLIANRDRIKQDLAQLASKAVSEEVMT